MISYYGKKKKLSGIKDIVGLGAFRRRGGACDKIKLRAQGSLVERFEQKWEAEKGASIANI